jgi:hypothetical protein
VRLSNKLAEFYAPNSDPSQTRPSEESCPDEIRAAFASLADSSIARTFDDCPVLADDEP